MNKIQCSLCETSHLDTPSSSSSLSLVDLHQESCPYRSESCPLTFLNIPGATHKNGQSIDETAIINDFLQRLSTILYSLLHCHDLSVTLTNWCLSKSLTMEVKEMSLTSIKSFGQILTVKEFAENEEVLDIVQQILTDSNEENLTKEKECLRALFVLSMYGWASENPRRDEITLFCDICQRKIHFHPQKNTIFSFDLVKQHRHYCPFVNDQIDLEEKTVDSKAVKGFEVCAQVLQEFVAEKRLLIREISQKKRKRPDEIDKEADNGSDGKTIVGNEEVFKRIRLLLAGYNHHK